MTPAMLHRKQQQEWWLMLFRETETTVNVMVLRKVIGMPKVVEGVWPAKGGQGQPKVRARPAQDLTRGQPKAAHDKAYAPHHTAMRWYLCCPRTR